MSFTGCSHVTINGGIISVVGGNQHNNHGLGTGNDLVRLVDPSEGQSSALTEYRKLKTPDIRLKRKIADTPVKRWDWEGQRKGWGSLEARRVIYAATIEDQGEKEFMYVKYEGTNAVQAYQQDFKTFSAVKDINWVELFGYITYNMLPALVFYDALVPVSHIFERNGFSSILEMYLCYSAKAQGVDAQTLFCELWTNPRNGTFHRGPYVADSSDLNYIVWSWSGLALSSSEHPSLDLQTYNNTGTLFQYLIGILPVCNIIQGIRFSNRATPEWTDNEDTKLILSSLLGTIYHRTTREVIAHYPGDRDQWYYYPWKEQFRVPDAMRENTLVMHDRTVRFMLTQADIASIKSFELYYDLQPGGLWDSFADSWVSQAHGIFSQLGIEEGEWGEYSILSRFCLYFEQERKGSHIHTYIPPSTPIYLFIRPVPCPCNDKKEWDAWLGGRRYYWSFDSTGKEVSEGERQKLGLPSFRTYIQVWHIWWDRDAHDVIKMLNDHEGFDPMSMDLARSLGQTILEVVGDGRFEEVEDDDEETEDMASVTTNGESMSVNVETTVDTHFGPAADAAHVVDVHIELMPKPPSNSRKSWIQRLKVWFAQHFGRRKQKMSS